MKKNVAKGDILKSNPIEGHWTCSIVLSFQAANSDFNALCHIAVTNAIFTHDFDVSEVDFEELQIIYTVNNEGDIVPCIGVYASKLPDGIEVIGHTDAPKYYDQPLAFQVGNGSDGGWPHCGPLGASMGFQSVHQWREINDQANWLRDIEAAEQSHQAMLERLRNG